MLCMVIKIVLGGSQANITCYFNETTHTIHVYAQYALKHREADRVITYREKGRRDIHTCNYTTIIMHTLREGDKEREREYVNI